MTKYLTYAQRFGKMASLSVILLSALLGRAQKTLEFMVNSTPLTSVNLGLIDRALYGCISGEM